MTRYGFLALLCAALVVGSLVVLTVVKAGCIWQAVAVCVFIAASFFYMVFSYIWDAELTEAEYDQDE